MNLTQLENWQPPQSILKIKTLDMHTAGEPLRIITSGFPELPGNTILEKRRYMKNNFDHLRTSLMFEPRGHADMYGCIITEPVSRESDFGVLFLHNEGYSTMCGHAIIAVTKAAVECGFVKVTEPETKVKIDSPAGLITSYAVVEKGKVKEVYFHNVPSFVLMKNRSVEVDGIGKVFFDVAYGGAFYAFVNADKLGISMTADNYRELIEKGMAIKNSVIKNFEIKHPLERDLSFLYGTIFFGNPIGEANSRNVCIFAEGEVDRSPTGTGVSARAALHYHDGTLRMHEVMKIESILGTSFSTSPIKNIDFEGYKAVIPEVRGNANFTGRNEFWIDPDDEIKNGFILR